MNFHKTSRIASRCPSLYICFLCLIISGLAFAKPSNNRPNQQNNVDLIKAKGTVIAQGKNTEPVGPLAITSYKLERISLSRSMKAKIQGQTTQVNVAYRITVSGSFFSRALVPMICINDVSVDATEASDLKAIIGITFDKSILRNGATISVGYGNPDAPCNARDSLSTLPEKLELNENRI